MTVIANNTPWSREDGGRPDPKGFTCGLFGCFGPDCCVWECQCPTFCPCNESGDRLCDIFTKCECERCYCCLFCGPEIGSVSMCSCCLSCCSCCNSPFGKVRSFCECPSLCCCCGGEDNKYKGCQVCCCHCTCTRCPGMCCCCCCGDEQIMLDGDFKPVKSEGIERDL